MSSPLLGSSKIRISIFLRSSFLLEFGSRESVQSSLLCASTDVGTSLGVETVPMSADTCSAK